MSPFDREILFLILQFLDEENFKETFCMLGQESGIYFDMKHFEDQVMAGEWDEVERYLSRFTKFNEDRYSMKILVEIKMQKYLEALDRNDSTKALQILKNDFKAFPAVNEEDYKEFTQLLTLENFRKNKFWLYGDIKDARNILFNEMKKLVENNPLFRDRINFPPIKASRLKTMINQSLNLQHLLCNNPQPDPDFKTILADHSCPPTNVPSAAFLEYKRAPSSATIMEYQAINSEHLSKKICSRKSNEASSSVAIPAFNIPSLDDLPMKVVWTQNLSSSVKSFDFHPLHQSLILVGTNVGEISIWEVGSRVRIAHQAFKLWHASACFYHYEAVMEKRVTNSVNKCLWSPDGSIIGIAFSKLIVQTYAYNTNGQLMNQLGIDAHVGGVNDISFAHRNKRLSFITCGEDKMIKVWDAMTGRIQYVCKGHGQHLLRRLGPSDVESK